MTLGALGVVYGDIGTSPLYALHECFAGENPLPVTPDNVLGILSLIFWSLILIVSLKYLGVVMRAANKGEGGILALMSLAFPERSAKTDRRRATLVALGVFGAALLYGDGMITPSISVLSAVEGVKVATPALDHFVIPLTILILIALFAAQSHGTGKVGAVFGPVMVVWFATLAVLGIGGIMKDPHVLAGLNPRYGFHFLLQAGWPGFAVLGAVFLAVTGAEALYADMGHFGIRPIRIAWFVCVLPGLSLNYFGQGALLLHDPLAITNPFYLLAPHWMLYPLVVLATMATVIASQALISGAFSLTIQAVQLGYLPRIAVKHTSSRERGQIYLPHVNWFLLVACIGLVLGFESSSNLAAAYGIAVSLTMIMTTVLFYFAARRVWHWSGLHTALLCSLFLGVEIVFFGANCLKLMSGGWFPLAMGLIIFVFMSTWKRGRELVWQKLRPTTMPLEMFLDDAGLHKLPRVDGTAVFMSGNPEGTPLALLHNLKHNKVLHQRNLLLTIVTDDVPVVAAEDRCEVEKLTSGFQRLIAHYGFMEEPNVPELLAKAPLEGPAFKLGQTTFFLSRETIALAKSKSMPRWRQWIFALMARNAQAANSFYRIPSNRVIELGMQIQL
ncbi:MAG TPA: potassium transporter Kup [Dongiaceae bacterium]|nr:potassium transporter Kup [Dongiaceae bacterium]